MARPMVDDQFEAGQLQDGAVGELADVVGLAELQPAEHLLAHGAEATARIAQQNPIIGMNPGGNFTSAANRTDRPDVVDVPMGQDHRDRLQPVLADQLVEALFSVLTWVDDHAFLARGWRDDIAVGLE